MRGTPANLGPAPVGVIPVLTPQFFASSKANPTTSDVGTVVATPYGYSATSTPPPERHLLVAQPPEPTTLYGSGYTGKMVLKLDCPDRIRVLAGSTLRITAGGGNIDTGRGWFSQVDFYAFGDLDASGNPLGASAVPGGYGCVKVTSTTQLKNTRTVDAGTFFTCGYACDVDNTSAPAQDRYIYLCAIGTPARGYARRTDLVCILLEGTQRKAADGSGLVARDAYVDASTGVDTLSTTPDGSGNLPGSMARPFATPGFGVTQASIYPAGSVYVKSTQASPAMLDYAYGKGITIADASTLKRSGWDHIMIKPWPGQSLLYLDRTAVGCVDAGIYNGQFSWFPFSYNKVAIQNAVINMTRVGSFGPQIPYQAIHGTSIGFINVQFFNEGGLYGPGWLSEASDGIVNGYGSGWGDQNGPYQAFAINCSGKVQATGGFTLVAGGHFNTVWDTTFVGLQQTTWAYFDFRTTQVNFCSNNTSAGPLTVSGNTYDSFGQRAVLGLATEAVPCSCKISIKSGIATVACYSDDSTATPIVPPNLMYPQGSDGDLNQLSNIIFAVESGNPFSGQSHKITGLGTFNGVQAGFMPTFATTLPDQIVSGVYHFVANTVMDLIVNQGEGMHATVLSGAGVPAYNPSLTVLGTPSRSTPDYDASSVTMVSGLQYVYISSGQGLATLNNPIVSNKARAVSQTCLKSVGTLSNRTLTFRGAQFADPTNALTTVTDGNGKRVTMASALPVTMQGMQIAGIGTAAGAVVGDLFEITSSTNPASGGAATRGVVLAVASGVPTAIQMVNGGQYPNTPAGASGGAWPVHFLSTRNDGSTSTATGSFTVGQASQIGSAGDGSQFASLATQWGMSLWQGSRLVGRVANFNTANPSGSTLYRNATAVVTAKAGNQGTGKVVMDPIAILLAGGVPGTYKAVFSSPTVYAVNGPSGYIGSAYVNYPFANQVQFHIFADSTLGTAFVAGDEFDIVVTAGDAPIPANSFYLEGFDGGADLTGVTNWSFSYDQHGASAGDTVVFTGGADPTNSFCEIDTVVANVITFRGDKPAPSLTRNTNLTVAIYPSNLRKQIVVSDRGYDDYGKPITRQTAAIAVGDQIRSTDQSPHSDRFQIQEPGSPVRKLENILMSNVVNNGLYYQPLQQSGQDCTTGTMNIHAAGDGFGQNDGCDVTFTLATLPVTSIVKLTPSDYYIDGKHYYGYSFKSDYASAPAGTNLYPWFDVRMPMRLKFLTAYAGKSFRVWQQTTPNPVSTLATITILDDQNVLNGGNLVITTSDTYQQPLPIGDGMVVMINNGTINQGRIWTNDPVNPGAGRIHRPWLGDCAVSKALTGVTSWWIPNTMKDMLFLASCCGDGVRGQASPPNAGSGVGESFAWNNVGWVQSTENISTGSYGAVPLKGTAMLKVGVIDCLHGGFDAGYGNGGGFSTYAGIDLAEALFANSNFNQVLRIGGTRCPANAGVDNTKMSQPGYLPEPCTIDGLDQGTLNAGFQVVTVDPGSSALDTLGISYLPLTNTGRIQKIGAGKLLFGWDAYGNPVASDGTALIGGRQLAA